MEDMPPLDAGEYLHEILLEVGPCNDGMAITGITWRDIDAWVRVTGERLSPWSARVLHGLSRSYAAEYRACSDSNARTPPWLPKMTEKRASAIAKKAIAALS